jgi:hypothetical protein
LEQCLKDIYDRTASAPIPREFRELLNELERREADSKRGR